MIDKYINDPQSFADWQNNTRALKARIAALEAENKQLRRSLENCLAILRNVEFIDTGGVVYQARALLEAS